MFMPLSPHLLNRTHAYRCTLLSVIVLSPIASLLFFNMSRNNVVLLLYRLLTSLPLSNENEERKKNGRRIIRVGVRGCQKCTKPRRVVLMLYLHVLRLVGWKSNADKEKASKLVSTKQQTSKQTYIPRL